MFTLRIHLVLPVCLIAIGIAGLSNAQQFGENSVVGQDFDYEEPSPIPTRFQATGPVTRNKFSSQPSTTRAPPVQILKQINRHNEDGSYTYGFEGSDGSFKIETKLANGEVKGKYGYVDDSGKVRVVEYGANRFGFQPSGEGITVAPPTLVDESKLKKKKVPAGSRFQGPSAFDIALGSRDQGAIPVTEDDEYDDSQDSEDQQQAQPQPIAQPQPQPQFQSRTVGRPVQARARPVARPAVAAPIQRPSANFEFGLNSDAASFQQQQSFGSAPQQASFAQQAAFAQQSPTGPVPPRAQIPGAAPVAPAVPVAGPARSRGQPRPAPQFLDFQGPQARQATRSAPRQFPSSGGAASSFDELEKEYALPSGGSNPTHDFQFGAAF